MNQREKRENITGVVMKVLAVVGALYLAVKDSRRRKIMGEHS